MMNLDLEAARASHKLIEETSKDIVGAENNNRRKPTKNEVENLITKTLGVLQENGIYGCIRYLDSRTNKAEKAIGSQIKIRLIQITKDNIRPDGSDNVYDYLEKEICSDLDRLILTKQLWEQTLTYARYGAKARE